MLRGSGVCIVRARVGLITAALVVVSVSGAAAQGYYPPPPGYYPPPPADYYGPPDGYDAPYYGPGPVPPGDVGGIEPGYGAPYGPSASAPPPPYPPPQYPPSRSYGRADYGRADYAYPGASGDVPRPPAGVSGDVTGSIHPASPADRNAVAGLPPEDQPESGPAADLPQQFHRQLVNYNTPEPAGTIIIDTQHTFLYLVLGPGRALRYGVGVGREGFTWSGTERVSHMSEWPDWHPPKEMIERQPYLPRFMAGGDGNPLGARALYLGNTIYRIHGTNQPSTIGHFVSSGCIRLTNDDITDLYSRVNVGTRVVVLPGAPSVSAAAQTPVAR